MQEESKQEIRQEHLRRRELLTTWQRKEKSDRIIAGLRQERCYQEADTILFYVSYKSEVDTHTLLQEELALKNKSIFCPRVTGETMEFYEITDYLQLEPGYQGIMEPAADSRRRFAFNIRQERKCLMLMPGAAFDKNRGRIGYGKGFYDKYLAWCPEIATAALAYDCQITRRNIAAASHDIRPDMIFTESTIIM